MVLLSLLAVGLLSLSTVSLRASNQLENQQIARANARLALGLAVAELQKKAGVDTRITAPASLANPAAPPNLAAVWRSAAPDAGEPVVEAEERFVGYLVSGAGADPAAVPPAEGVTMIGEGSMGAEADPQLLVEAPTVEMQDATADRPSGRYAWVAFDESLKANARLLREEREELAMPEIVGLGSASRFGMESFESLKEIDWFTETRQALAVSHSTGDLFAAEAGTPAAGDGPSGAFTRQQHELTVFSRGVMADAARGGLKTDLSRLFNDDTLPDDYRGGRLYRDDQVVATEEASPYWEQLSDYSKLYRDLEEGAGGDYTLEARFPARGAPRLDRRADAYIDPVVPEESPLTPIVAKVELEFTLVAKDAHGNWAASTIYNKTQDARRTYMLYMIYTPIVTLYNPYNVPLEFRTMGIEFKDVPIGFRFYRNGQAQTNQLAHFNQLYLYNDQNSSVAKKFGLNLTPSLGSSSSTSIVLGPGETKVFGESVDGDWSWDNRGGGNMFDWVNSGGEGLTTNLDLAPGYAKGVGFWIDWLTPDHMLTAADDGMGIISLRSTDTVDVEFGPMGSDAAQNRFAIDVTLTGADRRAREVRCGQFYLSYNDRRNPDGLLAREIWDQGATTRLQRPYRTTEIYQRPTDKFKDFSRVKPFVTFSFEAKTTMDSVGPAKPWVQGSNASNMAVIRLEDGGQARHSHQASMRPIAPAADYPWDPVTERAYFFTANDAELGVTVAPQFEVPFAPLQSIAQLRHARLSPQGFEGMCSYTLGESFASPMIPSDQVTADSTTEGKVLDHVWLANNALWDGYFFSTITDLEGPAVGTEKDSQQVAEEFFSGETRLLNPRFSPAPLVSDDAAIAAVTGEDGHLQTAAHLMLDGPFNVNSLSKGAWKALLGSMNREDVAYLEAATGEEGVSEEAENPFSRMRRASGPAVEEAEDGLEQEQRQARWSGFRSLTDEQIDQLAERLIEEIQERGPFLSLADFVNRRPGTDTAPALKGALQAAIDATDVNEAFEADGRLLTETDTSGQQLEFPEALQGPSATGAPGFLTQGDILSSVGQVLTVRSDTFRVRSYGEALDASGKVTARAWCEAIVQRTPEYLDPADAAHEAPEAPSNQRFGRRFVITHFRWLSPDEV